MECKSRTPWTDEEGRYDSYLCLRDCTECHFDCENHIKNEWKAEMQRLNENLKEVSFINLKG